MILSASHISKSFGGIDVIKDASILINEREKAAIVGNNGAGKTTLLDMLTGTTEPDTGIITVSSGTSIGYLRQINEIDSDDTVLSEMNQSVAYLTELEARLLKVQEEMKNASGEELELLYDTFEKLTDRYERADGYSAKSRVTGILKGLGFAEEEFGKPCRHLSGGEKTRLFLGKLLIEHPDIIFLDEPTNHLDLSSIEWLEGFLLNYKGTVIVVSHDRYFLDRIVGKVIDIDQGHVETYTGNYSEFAQKKAMLYEARIKAYNKQQEEIRHQEDVIRKLQSFNREKSIKRAESRIKMLDKIERLEKPTEERSDMRLTFSQTIRSGNDVLRVEGISKTFNDGITLFRDLGFELKRGEHVALMGDNGTGKTTILKMLMGIKEPDCGQITFGAGVEIAYYDQEQQNLDMNKTVFDEIQDSYPDMDNTQVRNHLAAFLFTDEEVFKKISSLSGGERGRVSLAKLMLSRANFIILDEPTNHLDMMSKEILESAIRSFEGTVLCVSHDRYFVNRIATRILHLTHEKLLNYIGNYDYFIEKRDDVEKASGIGISSASVSPQTDGNLSYAQQKAVQAKLRKRQNEIRKCEAEINALEEKIKEIDSAFLDPLNQTNAEKLRNLQTDRDEAEARLSEYYEKWEQLCEEEP